MTNQRFNIGATIREFQFDAVVDEIHRGCDDVQIIVENPYTGKDEPRNIDKNLLTEARITEEGRSFVLNWREYEHEGRLETETYVIALDNPNIIITENIRPDLDVAKFRRLA